MGKAAQEALGPSRRSQPDRLGEGVFGLGKRTRPGGGQKAGKNPMDKGKKGSKRHVVVDGRGVPLCVIHTAANVYDTARFSRRP
jgi:hypothetical protein